MTWLIPRDRRYCRRYCVTLLYLYDSARIDNANDPKLERGTYANTPLEAWIWLPSLNPRPLLSSLVLDVQSQSSQPKAPHNCPGSVLKCKRMAYVMKLHVSIYTV